jgi:hypothetical protein
MDRFFIRVIFQKIHEKYFFGLILNIFGHILELKKKIQKKIKIMRTVVYDLLSPQVIITGYVIHSIWTKIEASRRNLI